MGVGSQSVSAREVADAYPELRALARRMMGRERGDHTLQPTALVHEAFLRLERQHNLHGADRATFLAAAARAMRHILIDHARAKRAQKRDGGRRTALDDALAWYQQQPLDLIALDDALKGLETVDSQWAKIVEMRFFIGLSEETIAETMGLSTRTVERGWRAARVWLYSQLKDAE